ncbi:FAD-dependent monooxygenase [Micromonospora sp. CPCC 206061]|uniref:FAD-dependent monooxygenase n=1 Tax=Micromonospora sp. CPCC 206061 TaxID=3122410 RepID=UPI002FF2F6B6
MSDRPRRGSPASPVGVLVVGAGPTGLALAAQLAAHGTPCRLIDRNLDTARESRALAIQPRTLEVLAGLGVTAELIQLGNPNVQLRLHARGRTQSIPMFELGLADTAYPYLLFLSQAETERVLADHLHTQGVTVERGVELTAMAAHHDRVTCQLRHRDGRAENLDATYVVGCDGAHSTVRDLAGIAFEGGSYPQTFVLADVEADGLKPGQAHVFLSAQGMLFFFPLVTPASWRLLAMRPRNDRTPAAAPVTLEQVQQLADAYTAASVRLRDPIWMTNFRLHHRAAARYRTGRVFLAGDAAHIHSPAGAQGMNTGIQDAINLGWKLAHTLDGANPALLDTYEVERAPIGRMVLRMSDRAFTIATATNPVTRFARTRLAPTLLPLTLKAQKARAYLFRTVSQLAIRYRHSPLSVDGPNAPRRGPRAGDRLPDAAVLHNGTPSTLHAVLAAAGWHLLLCGPTERWTSDLDRLSEHYREALTVHHLSTRAGPGVLHDPDAKSLHRLGLTPTGTAVFLTRPDGHIGYRSGIPDAPAVARYLAQWLPRPNH